MEPELAAIDRILDDEELFQLLKADLAKHRPKTLLTGRNSTPVEVIGRMLAVKRLYGFSYADTERHVRDSLTLRWFCRIYFNPVFEHSNLNKWALLTLAPERKCRCPTRDPTRFQPTLNGHCDQFESDTRAETADRWHRG